MATARGPTTELFAEVPHERLGPVRDEDGFESVKVDSGLPGAEFAGGVNLQEALCYWIWDTPPANGRWIEGLEPEAEGIDLTMASGVSGVGPVADEALANNALGGKARLKTAVPTDRGLVERKQDSPRGAQAIKTRSRSVAGFLFFSRMATPAYHLPLLNSRGAQFSPDGALLGVALRGGVVLFEVHTRRIFATVMPGRIVYDLHFSPDGRTLGVLDWNGQLVFFSLTDSGAIPLQIWEPSNISHFEFSGCGKFLVTLSQSEELAVIDLARDECVFEDFGSPVADFTFSRKRDVWVTAHTDRRGKKGHDGTRRTEFHVWSWPFDQDTCRVLPYRVPDFCRMALSPAGDLLAVLFRNGEDQLQVYSLSQQMILHAQPAVGEPSALLAWSPCGRYLGFGTQNGAGVGVLDFQTRQPIFDTCVGRIDGDCIGDWPSVIDFSPDGALLAISAPQGGIVKLPVAGKRAKSSRRRS